MLVCRSLFRVDRALRFADTCIKSKTVSYFQGHCSYHNLIPKAKYTPSDMGRNKKQKIINPVWRPVSMQANANEEHLVKNVTVETEDGSQVQEEHSQNIIEVAEAVNDDVTTSSSTLQDNDEVRPLEGKSIIPAEKHSLSLEIGASVIRFIRGKEGSTQKKIEEEMGVKIIFPSSKKEDSVIVEGNSVDSVTRAAKRIQTIIDEAVKSPSLDYSHFVSLPLAIHPELVDKLVNFQNSILGNTDACIDEDSDSDSNEDTSEFEDKGKELDKGSDVAVELKDEEDNVKVGLKSISLVSYLPKASKTPTLSDLGIEKSIFIKPKTFHLTVLMLKLWNKDRVNAASKVLKSISSKVMDALDNRPVLVRLKGLDSMRGSLSKARVLYAPVEEIGNEDRLLRACEVITDAFVEAGLVLEKDAKQKLKLHATVMNARHRKRKKKTRKVDSFDARGIFKQFGCEEWGEYLIREAHLSQRFLFDESGYYHCCASIPFPESMQDN